MVTYIAHCTGNTFLSGEMWEFNDHGSVSINFTNAAPISTVVLCSWKHSNLRLLCVGYTSQGQHWCLQYLWVSKPAHARLGHSFSLVFTTQCTHICALATCCAVLVLPFCSQRSHLHIAPHKNVFPVQLTIQDTNRNKLAFLLFSVCLFTALSTSWPVSAFNRFCSNELTLPKSLSFESSHTHTTG